MKMDRKKYLFFFSLVASLYLGWGGALSQAAERPPLLAPELRLERVIRLAQAYAPVGMDALVCPKAPPDMAIDGDLNDWLDPNGSGGLRFQKEADFAVNLQARWDVENLYLALEIEDDVFWAGETGDPFGGDLLGLTLYPEKARPVEGAASLYIYYGAEAVQVFDARGEPSPAVAALSVAADSRFLEIALPWKAASALEPFSRRRLYLALYAQDFDSAQEAAPRVLDTHGDEAEIYLTTGKSGRVTSNLDLEATSIKSYQPFVATLFVEMPRTVEDVVLKWEIGRQVEGGNNGAAAGAGRNIIRRIAKEQILESGTNIFRLYWDSPQTPLGQYILAVSGERAGETLFSAARDFEVSENSSPWERLDDYRRHISVEAVLERISEGYQASDKEGLRFAVLGDNRDGEQIFKTLLNRAAEEGAQFAIVIGDLVSNGRFNEYLELAEILDNAPLPVLVAPGNHDYRNQGRLYYRRLFGETDYTFELGGYYFIVVDNATGRMSEAQLARLEAELQNPLPRFVFAHYPPSTIPEYAWHSFSQGAERFTGLMEQYKPERVFLSHIHALDRKLRNGVTYILSGGAGAPLYREQMGEAAVHGYFLVEVTDEGVADTKVSLSWAQETQAPPPAEVPEEGGEAMDTGEAPLAPPEPETAPRPAEQKPEPVGVGEAP